MGLPSPACRSAQSGAIVSLGAAVLGKMTGVKLKRPSVPNEIKPLDEMETVVLAAPKKLNVNPMGIPVTKPSSPRLGEPGSGTETGLPVAEMSSNVLAHDTGPE